MWSYKNSIFTSDQIQDHVGFVYEIYDVETGMIYIGKKRFWRTIRKPPLKGKKRKRKEIKESDWQDYYGSSQKVKDLLEASTPKRFKRKIIRLCQSLGEMSYFEMHEQMSRHVLLQPDKYYNRFVGGKIHGSHLKNISYPSLKSNKKK